MTQVSLITVDRSPSYVHGTLESLMTADTSAASLLPVNVIVCGSDPGFLGPWQTDSRVTIDLASSAEAEALRTRGPTARACRTALRALEGVGPLLFCEDDIVFARDWWKDTRLLVDVSGGGSFVLALWTAAHLGGDSRRCIVPYSAHQFYGTICTYFSAPARSALREFVRPRVDEAPFDMLVKKFCQQGQARLFAAMPSLVEHVGDVSTLGVRAKRRARKFKGAQHG